MGLYHRFDRRGDQIPLGEDVVLAISLSDPIARSRYIELSRIAAGTQNSLSHVTGKFAKRFMPGIYITPRIDNRNLRLFYILHAIS